MISKVWKNPPAFFQCLEKPPPIFSNVWKNRRKIFQCLEKLAGCFPIPRNAGQVFGKTAERGSGLEFRLQPEEPPEGGPPNETVWSAGFSRSDGGRAP